MVANFNRGDIRPRVGLFNSAVGKMLNLEACFPAVAEHVAYAYVISKLECRRKGAAVISLVCDYVLLPAILAKTS